jgi:hypothetical protein
MALRPTSPPTNRRDLKGAINEIIEDGEPGQWYIITAYDKHSTARDISSKLNRTHDGIHIVTRQGVVYGMKETTNDQ